MSCNSLLAVLHVTLMLGASISVRGRCWVLLPKNEAPRFHSHLNSELMQISPLSLHGLCFLPGGIMSFTNVSNCYSCLSYF